MDLPTPPFASDNDDLGDDLDPSPWQPAASAEEVEAFSTILRLLHDSSGVDFSHYRQSTVLRRCQRRMALRKLVTFAEYATALARDDQELRQLYRDLLLFFTEFFRDPQVFDTLKEEIFPRLVENRTVKSPIRVWVPGCSTGEEVYSLAICLYEFLEAHRLEVGAQFFGTDLVDRHIGVARAAIYGEKSVKNISAERLERFFDKTPQGYRVIKRIREMCVFATQDITQDPPFPSIDLLSCRNLLIYFDATFQATVIPLFHFALKPSGFLLLGTSESLGRFPELFTPFDSHGSIYCKRFLGSRAPYRLPVNQPAFNNKIRNLGETSQPLKGPELEELDRQIERLLLQRHTPPGVLVDADMHIRRFHGRTARYLEPATGEASLKLSKMAGNSIMPDLYVAVEEVKRTGRSVRKRSIPFDRDEGQYSVDVSVHPFANAGDGEMFFLILFEGEREQDAAPTGNTLAEGDDDGRSELELRELRRELMATKEYLQTIIEEKDEVNQELWSANEEVQSTNEELQSVNEELEAAKEELESSNEELIAVNEELHLKNIELTEASAFSESTINGSMDGILTCDSSLQIKIWNPAMERMWGVKREDCLNGSLLELFPFLRVNGQEEVLRAVLRGEPAIVANQPYIHRQLGREGFFEGRYSPLRDRNGHIIGVLAIIHDSTERKWAEEKLQESEERLKMVIEQSPAAVEIYDLDGLLVGANHACEKLWGHSAPAMINRFNILLHTDAARANLLPSVRRAYHGEAVFIPEYLLPGEGDAGAPKDRWLSVHIYPLKNRERVTSIVLSCEDISAAKRTEEDLQKIHKLESIGTLAGGIAHDFNNILTGLFGSLAIATAELQPDHPAMEHLRDAQRSMERATRLTQQLLIFAKGGVPLREGVSIDGLVEEVVRFDLSGSNVKPVFDIAPDLWVAEVDKGQIQQVFSNLTLNAKQAMPEGGHLFITLVNSVVGEGEIAGLKPGRYVRATFRDEGVGIEQRHVARIFDPYYTTKRFGRGLGLAITYTIVKKHGGGIVVDSAPDIGSTFTLYLPAPAADQENLSQPQPATPLSAPGDERPRRVLIMDDEEMICKVAARFLAKEGFLTEIAHEGREAIISYRRAMERGQPFDLVIMDLTIPGGMGGREAVKRLLDLHPEARVIVSSGYAEDPVLANYRSHGFRGIAPKPYTREGLLQVVRQTLRER